MKKNDIMKSFSITKTIISCVLLLYCISLLFILIWSLISTFKFQNDFLSNVIGLPSKEYGWTLTNYFTAFKEFYITVNINTRVYIETMLINTLLYTVGCAFFATLTPCLMAYLCAKFRFRFGKIIYTTVIVTMIIPIVGSLPSEYSLVKALGFDNNFLGMYVMKANFLGIYFLVFYASWKSLPNDFIEAARVDGMNDFGILLKIMFPLIKTTFGVIFVLYFVTFWNDYQVPMLYIPNYPTMAYGLFDIFQGGAARRAETSSDVMKLTFANVVMMPILILFVFMKDKLIGNLTVGGVKG